MVKKMQIKNAINKIMDNLILDYVPIISLSSNTKILVEKYIHRHDLAVDHINDRHIQHIKHKSTVRCVFAAIFPVVSIPVLAPIDLYNVFRKKKIETTNLVKDFVQIDPQMYRDIRVISKIQNNLHNNQYSYMQLKQQRYNSLGNSCNVSYNMIITPNAIFPCKPEIDGIYLYKIDTTPPKWSLSFVTDNGWDLKHQNQWSTVQNFQELFQFIELDNPQRMDVRSMDDLPTVYRV